MSQPDVAAIAAALGTALSTIHGLRVIDYLSDTISPPVALVGIETVDYHGSFDDALHGGDVLHTFTVYVVVGRASDRAGIAQMEGYMSQPGSSANSIPGALEVDRTLGGLVSTLIVTKAGPPASISMNSAVYISLPFTVEVHA